jgi:hypothetical protein
VGCGLWVVGCGLWVAGCGFWVVGCWLWVVGCGLWVVGCGLWDVGSIISGSEYEIARKMKNVCFSRWSIDTAARSFRGGGAPRSPYRRFKPRRLDIPSARSP